MDTPPSAGMVLIHKHNQHRCLASGNSKWHASAVFEAPAEWKLDLQPELCLHLAPDWGRMNGGQWAT